MMNKETGCKGREKKAEWRQKKREKGNRGGI
jgi:hypothetical protein